MNVFEHSQSRWHRRFLNQLDAKAALPADADLEARQGARLRSAQLLLVAGGAFGVQALRSLRQLPGLRLAVAPLRPQDMGALQQALKEPVSARAGKAELVVRSFDKHALAPSLHGVDAVAFAASRPHPARLAELNQLAVRHGLPLMQATLDNAEFDFGPTVLPGATACQHCAEVRLAAGTQQADVWEARRQFFDRNPDFEHAGRHPSLERMAAALLTAEAERLIGGHQALVAAGHLLRYDVLVNPLSSHFIPYYEWCPVCRPSLGPEGCSADFQAFLQRQGVVLSSPQHPNRSAA